MCWVRTVGSKQPKTIREALGQACGLWHNWAARTTSRGFFSLLILLPSVRLPLSALTVPARPCGIKKAPRSIRLYNLMVHIPRESLTVSISLSLAFKGKGTDFSHLGSSAIQPTSWRRRQFIEKNAGPMIQYCPFCLDSLSFYISELLVLNNLFISISSYLIFKIFQAVNSFYWQVWPYP